MAKASSSKKTTSPTKSQIIAELAEQTGLGKKEVQAVITAMSAGIQSALNNKKLGAYTIPGLVKITRKAVPAKAARKNVADPFTGQLRDYPAKPASVKVAVRALKNLKDMVG